MNEKIIKLDRNIKILLLNVLKKGYFDENDTLQLSKYAVFNIPIEEWINQNNRL